MKKILVSLALFVTFLISGQSAFAADINVTCTSSSCSPSFSPGFFSSADVWYPGLSMSKTIQFTNTASTVQTIDNHAENAASFGTANLANVIDFSIRRVSTNTVVWSGTLQQFYSAGTVILGSINSGSSDVYEYTGTMRTSAGNEYQDVQTRFDLVYGVDTAETPTPTPTSTTSSTPTPTPTTCTDQKPVTPSGPSLSQLDSTSVRVTWPAVNDPKTGYVLSWGSNQNAEGSGTRALSGTETIVTELNLNTTRYYFKVRAVNGCSFGDYSGISSIGSGPDLNNPPGGGGGGGSVGGTSTTSGGTTGGTVLGASTGGFLSQLGSVLGLDTDVEAEESTDEADVTPTVSPTPAGEVKGAATEKCEDQWWWQLVLLGYGILSVVLVMVRKRIVPRVRLVLNAVITLVTAILLYVALCWPWPWILGVVIVSIALQYFFKSSQIYRTTLPKTTKKAVEPNIPKEDEAIKPVKRKSTAKPEV